MNFKKLYLHDKNYYFLKICEELSELQTAALHYKDNKILVDEVIEEIADATIQLDKLLAWLSGFDDETHEILLQNVKNKIEEKLENLDAIISLIKD